MIHPLKARLTTKNVRMGNIYRPSPWSVSVLVLQMKLLSKRRTKSEGSVSVPVNFLVTVTKYVTRGILRDNLIVYVDLEFKWMLSLHSRGGLAMEAVSEET